jgi:hypothetical protein
MQTLANLVVVLVLTSTCLSSNDDHWFVFERFRFPAFYTSLLTLTSMVDNSTNTSDYVNISLSLDNYRQSIVLDIDHRHDTNELVEQQTRIELNIARADFLQQQIDQVIFLAVKQHRLFEVYVNCKLIDTYLFTSSMNNNNEHNRTLLQVNRIHRHIKHNQFSSLNMSARQQFFDIWSCKTSANISISNQTATSIVDRSLIRQMQQIIERVQQQHRNR